MLTIVVINAQPILRKGLSLVLKNHFSDAVILETESISSFSTEHPDVKPDLFIIGQTGNNESNDLKLIVSLKKTFSDGKVVIYEGDQTNIINYFKVGIQGYVSKQAEVEELISCINDVLKGKVFLSHEAMIQFLVKDSPASANPKASFALKNSKSLTSREYEIARYLSDGLSTSLIAQKLERKSSTISTIKKNVYKKLNISNIVELRKILKQS